MLLVGLVVALPVWYLSGYLWGKFVGSRWILPVPSLFGSEDRDQRFSSSSTRGSPRWAARA